MDFELEGHDERELRAWVASSLRTIGEIAETRLGEQEAIRRARALEKQILASRLSPASVGLDDPFREVLYALIYRVLDEGSRSLSETARRARAVCGFIRDLPWERDELDERNALLKDCAALASAAPARRPAAETETGPLDDAPEDETRAAFERALPVVHVALTEIHGLTESRARQLERELFLWFSRLGRRAALSRRNSRWLLLSAASQVAREYRHCRGDSRESAIEARLALILRQAFSQAASTEADGEDRGR